MKIDWKSKINPQYLVLNRQKKDEIERIYKKPFNEIDVAADKVEDRHCLLLLQGIRELLQERGYTSVEYRVNSCSLDYVSTTCRINFKQNEEFPAGQIYEFTAAAHPGNTFSWYGQYLDAAASNRALCLCVRNALGINIVAQEELGADNTEDKSNKKVMLPGGPHATLEKKLKEKNTSFDQFKHFCVGKKIPNAETWTDIPSVKIEQVMSLLDLMNNKDKNGNKQG